MPGAAVLYADPSSPTLDLRAVSEFLHATLGLPCTVRGDVFVEHGGTDLEALARAIAATKVRDLGRPFEAHEPLFGEVTFELRLLKDPGKRVPGILYDAHRYADILRDLLPVEERSLRTLPVVFGHRLIGTFDEDGRYHARTVLCGVPGLVSTSGLVEAPAKPPEYYRVKARLSAALGAVPFDAAKEPFAGRFVDYDDPRLTEVAKGYALQAAWYLATGEAFCEDPTCRLFNAHWQSELLAAQIASGRLCARHARTASRIRAPARQRKG
ncbi:MAG: DUF6775 family putative metallopeptidase [Methanobacteriota archaeon]